MQKSYFFKKRPDPIQRNILNRSYKSFCILQACPLGEVCSSVREAWGIVHDKQGEQPKKVKFEFLK